MTKRIKKAIDPSLETRADAEAALGRLAEMTYSRDHAVAKLELELKAIRENYEYHIARLNADIDAEFDALNVWADGNPTEFGVRRSLDMVHGTIGYRTGQPRLKLLRGWNWDKVAAAVQTIMPFYLRVRCEANKDAMIDDRALIGQEKLAYMGVSVVQDETFYVTPKQEGA